MNKIGKQLAAIHILKDRIGMDDVAYRAFLLARFGVESSRKLSSDDRDACAEFLRNAMRPRKRIARFILVLWNQLRPMLGTRERKGAYLVGFVRKAAKRSDFGCLADLDSLAPGELRSVVEALKSRLATEEEKAREIPF